MLATIPDTISKEENGWVSDLTLPHAIQLSELLEFRFIELLKSIFPQYTNYYLDEHAATRGLLRRKAEAAKAVLQIKGIAGTIIPKGFLFSTAATLEQAGVLFSLDEETTIGEDGQASADVTATITGTLGNTAAETIVLMVKPMKGINSLVNPKPSYGGFEEENDESLRQRILDYDRTQGISFVGSEADYRRWAMEVSGVGSVKVLSATDDSGLVTLILTDLNGEPAGEQICDRVYHFIMRPDYPEDRIAPINALLKVMPPERVEIRISATLKLEEDAGLEEAKEDFILRLKAYFKTQEAQSEVKYHEVGSLLIQSAGVWDYQNLDINGSKENIEIPPYAMPVLAADGVVFQ